MPGYVIAHKGVQRRILINRALPFSMDLLVLTMEAGSSFQEAVEILTQSDPEIIRKPLKAHGMCDHDSLIRKVLPDQIPAYLSAADLAVSFIKPSYSKLASSPTKIPEYLIAGLPVVCNSGIGDCDEVIRDDKVGVLIDTFAESAYLKALESAVALRSDPATPGRCVECAARRFDLTSVGGPRYRRLYERVMTAN